VIEGVERFWQTSTSTRCARGLAETKSWRTLMTNSAKLVNIIGGYEPVLAPMHRCIRSAIADRIQG
jgi:hypothetical protein